MKTAVWNSERDKRINDLVNEDGYFTVEASFLVPMVCFLVVGVMMIGIYLCDLNLAKSFLNRRVSEVASREADYEIEDQKKDQEWLEKQLFFTKIDNFSITRTDSKAKGEVELQMDLAVPLVGSWMGNLWKDSFFYSEDVCDQVEWMRRWDQLE